MLPHCQATFMSVWPRHGRDDLAHNHGVSDSAAAPCFRLPVTVVLDNIRSLYNTGSFFRTADACAVDRLILCGITPRPDQGGRQQRAIAKTALGAEVTVPWEYVADSAAAIGGIRSARHHVVIVETSVDAISLYEWQPQWPVCLVFGHETDGVSSEIASQVDTHVRIPMFGGKRSLNVATAAGVVLYELVRRRLSPP